MAFAKTALRSAEQPDKAVARITPASGGAWLTILTASIDLTSRNPRDPDPWPFRTPDGPVAIPDRHRRAGELLAGSDHRQQSGEHPDHLIVFSVASAFANTSAGTVTVPRQVAPRSRN